MPKTFRFNVPDIVCESCIQTIESLVNGSGLTIESFAGNAIEKTVTITVAEDGRSEKELGDKLQNEIKECFETVELINADNDVIVPADQVSETTPLVTTSSGKKVKAKKRSIRSHIIKGVIGLAIGVGLMAITLSSIVLPPVAMFVLMGVSAVATFAIGADSYLSAAKKLFKAKTLTMDALFAVSTIAIVGVSIASMFLPGLPMMMEAGLLIFGFRHIGKAIEESISEKVTSGLTFKDRAVARVEKWIEVDGISTWDECDISVLAIGNVIRVKRGEVIPVDGECESEETSIYKTIVTGSTIPVIIKRGEKILAGMKVPDDVDYIDIRVKRLPAESYLARLDQKISQANSEKAPLETVANKILQYFIPAIFVIALAVGIGFGVGASLALGIQAAATVLVSACPCTLGFITPLAVKIGMSKALESGVQFKNGKALQSANDIDTVVFDLNGTLTTGVPVVTDHQIVHGQSAQDFFASLALLEKEAKHPIAKAIYSYARDKSSASLDVDISDVDQSNHSGIKAKIKGEECLVGNKNFLLENDIDCSGVHVETNPSEQVIYFVKNKKITGYVKIKDPLRNDAKLTIAELKRMGKDVHICTGADQDTAKRYAAELGIPDKNVFSNCVAVADHASDRTKSSYIQRLQENKKRVAMIGDAANDALAITNSDFGIAVQSDSGDEITQEQAGAVVGNSSLMPVVTAFAVAKQTVSNIKQNLLFSLGYNMVILGVGIALVAVGMAINPAIGVALMVIQTVLILANQYRIKRQELEHTKRFEEMQRFNASINSSHKNLHKNGLMLGAKPKPEMKKEDVKAPVATAAAPVTQPSLHLAMGMKRL